MELNPAQLLAVQSTTDRTVVVAGPGSGKTRVIVERIVARYGRNSSPRIVVITFTNAAAREIAARLSKHGITPYFVGTLHGYCFRLLQRYGHLLGYRRGGGLTIVSPEAREMILNETKAKLGYTKLALKAIEAGESTQAKAVLAEYRHTLKRQNMIDFDLILERVKDLFSNREIHEREVIAELYVDEAQDSGELDWIIYRAIPAAVKFYVGDDSQSIYKFRGADPGQFLLQAAIKENSQTLTLERNYRSDVRICAAANALIAHNTNRIAKMVNPESGCQGHVAEMVCEASRQEAIAIAGRLRDWKADGIPFEEMAVLARTNSIADEIRATLREMMVPVAFERVALPADWSLCLTVLQLMIEPANNILAELYLKEKTLPAATVNRLKMDALKSGKAITALAKAEFEWLRGGHPLPRQLTMAGVSRESVELVVERMSALPECSQMSDLLSDLWDTETWRPPATVAGVTVSTIHKAKGREWDAVAIAGCEEGVLPSLSKQADIEEERRMMFVALTRARHRVLLSHCRQRFAYGKRNDQQPSRFIAEMLPAVATGGNDEVERLRK